jgi:hypothetical protein
MTEIDKRQAIDQLFRVAGYARIAHHISGRIRIKFSLAAKKGLADLEFEPLTEQLPGIQHYRLNKKNGSLVIEYDPDVISEPLWEKLINGSQDERQALTEELLTIWNHH